MAEPDSSPYTVQSRSLKPVDDALYQQLQQERLLNQVTTQIRQSLELSVILSTAVEQLRQFLLVDRLLIYQFQLQPVIEVTDFKEIDLAESEYQFVDGSLQDLGSNSQSPVQRSNQGKVTYEARSSDDIRSTLSLSEPDFCLEVGCNFREKYRKGFIQSVANIEEAYRSSPCFTKFLKRLQVRSIIVVPIVVQEQLWGLLIAHQCLKVRHWKPMEKRFLNQITQHLSIAIYQAELYAQVQEQKATLEQRVQERTQALHDALLAAQSANRAKSQFLATMSHELRTPLTCVIGISETLLRYYTGTQSGKQMPIEKQKEYLKMIHDSGEKLLSLINDILDFTQIEAGKTVLKISEFSLAKLVKDTLTFFQEKAGKRSIQLFGDFQIQPSQHRFTGDLERIRQILSNLLENAIKFTPSGGQVTLRVRSDGNLAIFQVEDTGIGIADDKKSLLFEKFQQLNSAYNRQYEGAGLGLALTKQLVELHGGVIEFQSTLGLGSTFTVHIPTLPLVPKNLTDSTYKTGLPSSYLNRPQGKCVLIEHEEESATLICDLLTAAGYQVIWLIEGFTAVKKIELLRPDAVIIDLYLPGEESYEIIKQVNDKTTTKMIKILALTHPQCFLEPNSFQALRIYDILSKPIQPDELLNKMIELRVKS